MTTELALPTKIWWEMWYLKYLCSLNLRVTVICFSTGKLFQTFLQKVIYFAIVCICYVAIHQSLNLLQT